MNKVVFYGAINNIDFRIELLSAKQRNGNNIYKT